MRDKDDLEKYWNILRRQTTVDDSLEAIAFLENRLQLALAATAAWKTKLQSNPDIPTLQRAGIVFHGVVKDGAFRSPIVDHMLQFLDTL